MLDTEAIKAQMQQADGLNYDTKTGNVLRALLAENERLKRERSEWCDRADVLMTEHMTQQRDLLAENAALRARLTLTPERIEAAAKAIAALHESPCWDNCYEESWPDADVAARAALLAAGMREQEEAQP